jgi:capsid protein
MTRADIETRLALVRAAIDRALADGVAEFAHEGGDAAKMIPLRDLQAMETALLKQLAAYRRGRFSLLRPLILAGVLMAWQNHQVVAGPFVEPVELRASDTSRGTPQRTYTPHYSGASRNRNNWDFMPPHRSGDGAVRESWDLLTRRMRWLVENEPMMKRLVQSLALQCVGEGIGVFSAAVDHIPLGETTDLIRHPLFAYGDESDSRFERWADKGADVERQKSLWEMQFLSAVEVFGSGNSLWLECRKKSRHNLPATCFQLLEAEQLDRGMDRPAAPGRNRISNGIEYDSTNEPVAYHLFDAHPYDDTYAALSTTKSRRIPASRVTHIYLSTRASQHFGASLGNCALQAAKDSDWLVGHELTAAALAAGLTLLIKEDDESAAVGMDTEDTGLSPFAGDVNEGLRHLSEVGLSSGMAARVGLKESVEIIESSRPNRAVEPFVKFLANRMSMGANLSYHRFTGDPTGANFAVLRAMINDDRAMSLPLTYALGRKMAVHPREVHDRLCAATGLYRSLTSQQYLRDQWMYEDYDILGPPLRSLNPVEDVDAAKARIACGLSTLRIECGLLGLCYRRVLRQLAVERDLAKALGLALDFSSGGGAAGSRTTTDAQGEAA